MWGTMASCNIYGVVTQARMSSTRLPGKVLMDVEGKPMLQRQTERLLAGIGQLPLIVATSDHPSDDALEAFCKKQGVSCFRGSLDNLVLRFIQCAHAFGLTHIVRVGGDDPLIDPDCCLELVRLHKEKEGDFLYASNREGWPYGCAAELISLEALDRINTATSNPFFLEHTIPYFFDHPEEFNIKKVLAPESMRRPELAFTVDHPEDMEFVRSIFRKLLVEGELFPLSRVIRLMDEEPGLRNMNRHLHEGFNR